MQLHFPPIHYINVSNFEIHNVFTKTYLISSARPTVSLARCVLWLSTMLLHHTPLLENFHELLFMSSCTICPCLRISASFSQLTSSTRCPFHLTKYSKYSFLLVILLILLSIMLSIYGFSATDICFVH